MKTDATPAPPHLVLIVDDDSSLRSAVAINMQVAGYEVLEAADGVEALEQLRLRDDIHLVICDIVMPKMNGADFLEQARTIRPHLPFIMITGYSANELMGKALRNGAYTVLSKPFDPRALLTIAGRAITAPIVLVVNSAAEAASIAARLDRCCIRTHIAPSPEAVITALADRNVDVVIADIEGRDLSALDDVSRLRPDIRLIMLVNSDARPPKARTNAKVFTYIQKPVVTDHLIQILATARGTAERAH